MLNSEVHDSGIKIWKFFTVAICLGGFEGELYVKYIQIFVTRITNV